jgi:hypothetical protein
MNIILGMHRSGTSLIARQFFLAGADFGNPQDFHPADAWNPDGYYEQPAIHAINMPLIHGPWGRLAYLLPLSAQTILRRGQRLESRIRAAIQSFGNKTVKDCRFCLTLPAWRLHQAPIRRAVVCLRHPLAVARSLGQRNRLPRWLALSIWRQHIAALLTNLQEVPTWYIRYENLLRAETFASELQPALAHFGLTSSAEKLRSLFAQTIRPEKTTSRAEADLDLDDGTAASWQELLQRHARQRLGVAAA